MQASSGGVVSAGPKGHNDDYPDHQWSSESMGPPKFTLSSGSLVQKHLWQTRPPRTIRVDGMSLQAVTYTPSLQILISRVQVNTRRQFNHR
jgi:hypothetical protein